MLAGAVNLSGSDLSGGSAADFSSRITRLIFYILLCMVLMTLDHRGRWVDRVRDFATLAVEPVWLAVDAPVRWSQALAERVGDRTDLLDERDRLANELARSRAELQLLAELRRENNRLRDLLGASPATQRDFQAVELRQIDLDPWSHRLLIDRGAVEGLRVGQPVMDSEGLIGQVDRVHVHSASVILLSDPDHALPVEIERSRLRTIAYGTGQSGRIRLEDLPMNADIEPGDVVLSSGLGGRFPAGLPVADVLKVTRAPGEAFATAELVMRARLAGARHLLVITGQGALDLPFDVPVDVPVDMPGDGSDDIPGDIPDDIYDDGPLEAPVDVVVQSADGEQETAP